MSERNREKMRGEREREVGGRVTVTIEGGVCRGKLVEMGKWVLYGKK